MVYRLHVWVHSLYKLEKCTLVPLKALVLVSLVGHVREIALQTKRGIFHVFLEKKLRFWIITEWFAPVIEGLLYVEDFTTNWFSRTWPYMEFICTCSSIVNWKIKLIWQRRLLHMSISVEATGKYYTYNLCSICG